MNLSSRARFEVISAANDVLWPEQFAGSERAHAKACQLSAEDGGARWLVLDTFRTEEQGQVILTSEDPEGTEPADPVEVFS